MPANSQISAERVQAYIRTRFNPIRSLTPDLLSQYLDAFKIGYLRQCALLWDAIEERDDTLSSVIPKRKAAAARHGWDILLLDSVTDEQKAEAQAHKEALKYFYNNLTVMNAIDENERGEVSLLLRQMLDAVAKKYAVHEIVWQPTPDGLTAELRFVPLWFFEHITGRLRYLTTEGALEGVPMEDKDWLISVVTQSLMPACSVAYMYKTMSLKDWVIYNERHGMPGIHGKTDAAKDSDEWNAMVEAVQNFAADWAIVTNTSGSIDKIDMSTSGQLPYPPLVERMDRAMAALWRGADLSTISAGATDAGQGASLQGDESTILEQDDAAWLSETLSRQLDRAVIAWCFGEGVAPLAYIKIQTAQKKNITQDILIDTFLRDSGVPLGVKATLENYNRTLPAPEDTLLTKTAATPSVFPGPPPGTRGSAPAFCAGPPPGTRGSAPAFYAGPPPGTRGSAPAFYAGPPPPTPLSNATRHSKGDPLARPPASPDSPQVGKILANVRDEFAVAQDKVLAPIREQLENVLATAPAQLPQAISDFQAKLPTLLRQINADPETAKILEDTLGAALISGLSTGEPPSRPPRPPGEPK